MPEANEALFLDQVCTIARLQGWLVFHPTPHRVGSAAWRTDGKGFPDIVLAHHQRGVIFAELKTNSGKLSASQIDWRHSIAPHAEWYLWRPQHLEAIAKRLGPNYNK